jgi:hypothetical protein
LLHVRERWATVTNEALRAANIDARVDHRSLAAQGIDREPYPRIPRAAFEMERHGYRSILAERLRADYQARVAARNERTQSQSSSQSQSRSQSQSQSQSQRQPQADRGQSPQLTGQRQSLEDVRRQARENWLKMRQEAAQSSQSSQSTHSPPAGPRLARDDDFSR